jgi:molybdate transport system regulatory protein
VTLGGYRLTTVITNDSLHHLGLKVGKVVNAEIKAPWVILQKSGNDASTSSENILSGVVERIRQGKINTEYLIRLADGTAVCSMVSTESAIRLALEKGDQIYAMFNAYRSNYCIKSTINCHRREEANLSRGSPRFR